MSKPTPFRWTTHYMPSMLNRLGDKQTWLSLQWMGYVQAVAATGLATLLCWLLPGVLEDTPHLAFYPAIVAAAAFGGMGPGTLATVISLLCVDVLFTPPLWQLSPDPLEWARQGIFLASGVGISLVAGFRRAAQARQRRQEESLRQSEARLRGMFDNAAVGIIEVDIPGHLIAANDHVCRILGYRREELLGMTVRELTAAEDRPHSDQLNAELREGRRERLDYEKRYLRSDGSPLWVHVTVSTVRDSAGRPLRYIGTMEDISERRTWEEALRRSQQQLQALNQTLEQRVAERTAQAEQRAAQLRALATELTQAEQKERRRMAQVLHDHLQQLLVGARVNIGIARTPNGKEGGEKALQQVDGLLEESLNITRSLTAELSPSVLYMGSFADALRWLGASMRDKHGLAVDVKADAGVDPKAEDIRVLAFEATRELLFNVVKHAKVDRATVQLDLAGDDQMRIIVADQGVGCDPARDVGPKPSGGGFGLFSLRERLELLGGRLEMEGDPGRGCRMTVLAPLGAALQSEAGIQLREEATGHEAFGGQRLT